MSEQLDDAAESRPEHPVVTHKPGTGGLFAPGALCGATSGSGLLRMHEWEYDCAVCAEMAGEQ